MNKSSNKSGSFIAVLLMILLIFLTQLKAATLLNEDFQSGTGWTIWYAELAGSPSVAQISQQIITESSNKYLRTTTISGSSRNQGFYKSAGDAQATWVKWKFKKNGTATQRSCFGLEVQASDNNTYYIWYRVESGTNGYSTPIITHYLNIDNTTDWNNMEKNLNDAIIMAGSGLTVSFVKSVIAYGDGNWDDIQVNTTSGGTTIPTAPSGLSLSVISSTQINLSWTDNSSNEESFKIERKTGSAGTYVEIASVGANVTSYSNSGLTASTAYYYKVRAYNSAGYSAYSNEANATTSSSGGTNQWTLHTNNTDIYRQSGKVGIGLTDPYYMLDVEGTARAHEVIVNTNTGADFVLQPDYSMMTLQQLEQHIKAKKHLPGIPNAKQMVENGISVGEMQMKLLQKIEELTLYIIQQNESIQMQRKRIESLEAKNK